MNESGRNDLDENRALTGQMENRIVFYDIMRLSAIFAVVVLHVAAARYYHIDVRTMEWQTFNFYDSIVRWAVPVFVMISGALFLGGEHSITKIYKKNIARIAVSFVFWSMIYAVYDLAVSHCGWKEALKGFIQGPTHMWFLFMLVGLYMIIPLLRPIVESGELTKYFLLLSLVFTFILPQAIDLISLINEPIGLFANTTMGNMSFYFTLGYVSYFVAGYYLSKAELSRNVKWIIYLLGLCGFAATIVCTSVLSVWKQEADTRFYGNTTVNVMLTSLAVFVFVKDRFAERKISRKTAVVLAGLSKYSFGAYLVHAMVLFVLEGVVGFHKLLFMPVLSVPVMSILVFVISLAISGILNHIPILRRTV